MLASKSSRIKVVHLVTRLDSIGGAQIHVLELAKYWYLYGVTVVIWGGQEPAIQFQQLVIPVFRIPSLVRDLSPLRDCQAFFEIVTALRHDPPTVLMLHSSKAGVLGRLAALLVGVPCVFTAHGWSFSDGMPQPFRSVCWFFEFIIGTLDCHTITVSEYDRQLGLRLGVGREDRTCTVHNGVEDVPVELRARPEQSNRIVMVARHCPQKDHRSLLLALATGKQPFELVLVGDGPDIGMTRSLVEELGLVDKVKLLGARKDVGAILATAGLMVLSTNWEGLPRSIIEGMRAGLPIVGSDVGGNSELIQNGVNGYLVPQGDVPALQAAITRLLVSPDLRMNMGKASRDLYDRNFRSEMLFDRTLEVIKGVVSSGQWSSVI